jgi:hypothetical protein
LQANPTRSPTGVASRKSHSSIGALNFDLWSSDASSRPRESNGTAGSSALGQFDRNELGKLNSRRKSEGTENILNSSTQKARNFGFSTNYGLINRSEKLEEESLGAISSECLNGLRGAQTLSTRSCRRLMIGVQLKRNIWVHLKMVLKKRPFSTLNLGSIFIGEDTKDDRGSSGWNIHLKSEKLVWHHDEPNRRWDISPGWFVEVAHF